MMIDKKYILFGVLNIVLTLPLAAQNEPVADALMSSNKLVSVIVVLLVILIGIAVFLFFMDRRIKRLEQDN